VVLTVVFCLRRAGEDPRQRHLATREAHDPHGRLVAGDALPVQVALDAAKLVAPPGRADFSAVLLDVGFEFHITDSDTARAGCQALSVLFFTWGAARYNLATKPALGRTP
jgi:hypothetical protein